MGLVDQERKFNEETWGPFALSDFLKLLQTQ